MRIKSLLVAFLALFFCSAVAFSFIVEEKMGFPYKAIVMKSKTFRYDQVNMGDISTVKETYFRWEFSYKGKKYRADLLTIGAIYFEREGQNPTLIALDIRKYRMNRIIQTIFPYGIH